MASSDQSTLGNNRTTIIVAIVGLISAVTVAYLGYRATIDARRPNPSDPPTPEPRPITTASTSETISTPILSTSTGTIITTATLLVTEPAPTQIRAAPTSITTATTSTASNLDGMTLLYVPGGKFTMGDAGESYKVSLAAFWIDQTEVTNAMYANCVKANQCNPPRQNNSNMRTSYYGNSEFDNYPVIYVSWQDASDYCKSVGRRLPTEAEWEKAARGTDGRLYPWDTKPSPNKNLLNYNKEVGDTTAVGNYPAGASPFGVLDMAGNVMEWVSSLYRPYPYDPNDGREDMNTTDSRVQRGGSWNRQGDEYVSSAHRGYAAQTDNRSNEVGFRCALS